MSHLNQLREQRSKLVSDAREELNKISDDMDPSQVAEYEQRFDAIMADADRLDSKISKEQRLLDAEASLEQRVEMRAERSRLPKGEVEKAVDIEDRAFKNWLVGGISALSDEQRNHMLSRQVETRAQGVSSDPAGGFLVPEGFRNVLEKTIKTYGGIRSVANVFKTATGNTIPMPLADDTSNKGTIIAENTAVPEQDVAFGSVNIGAFMYTSKMVRVSYQLLQDAAFNLNDYLAEALGERIARATDEHFTVGTGVGQPQGIITAATEGKVAAAGQTTGIILDDLIDLVHSVDVAYRRNGVFVFNDATLRNIRKLKDSSGLPIWQPSVVVGEPDRILGLRYVISNEMASPAAGAKTVVFGDTSKFLIRDVLDLQMARLTERYSEFLQVGFMAYSRHDSRCVNPGAIKYFAQAAS